MVLMNLQKISTKNFKIHENNYSIKWYKIIYFENILKNKKVDGIVKIELHLNIKLIYLQNFAFVFYIFYYFIPFF